MDSYDVPGFATFYDAMVEGLPEEYEAGKDVDFFWAQLQRVLEAQGTARVLDLCTGTGRVVEGLVRHLALRRSSPSDVASPPVLQEQQGWTVALTGVDNSEHMLQVAQDKLQLSTLPAGVSCSWLCSDIANLPPQEDLGGPFDLIILSAGSFHHLLTKQEQLSCLTAIKHLLADHQAAVINLMPSSDLQAQPGTVMLAGGYCRECIDQEREEQPDGGVVWRQQFMLSLDTPPIASQGSAQRGEHEEEQAPRASSSASARQGGQEHGERGKEGQAMSQAAGDTQGTVEEAAGGAWEQEEGWALREVEPDEFRRLLEACGLRVVEQRVAFGNALSNKSEGPGRIFLIAKT
ncbi:hypothetical protein N2152v2_009298 [Parachlorella kessleri]